MTWTALHDLFASRPTPFTHAVVMKNAREFPDAIVSVDDRGYTPLHIAVTSNEPAFDAIKTLVKVYPNVVLSKDLHGDTPMHLALHPNADSKLIRILLDACSNVAFETNKEGLMPIHVACRYCFEKKEIIQLLIDANPSALRHRTKMGSLVQRKKKVAAALVPNESFAKNNQHLLLDCITSSTYKTSQIQGLSQTQFEERSRQLRDGSYPLHMALVSGAPLPVIEMLIKAAPDVLSLTDKFDRTCLHLAVANGATSDLYLTNEPAPLQGEHIPRISFEIIELIHAMDRKQISRQDKMKNYPLHTALQGGCSTKCEEFLIREYPQAVDAQNIDGLTPYELRHL